MARIHDLAHRLVQGDESDKYLGAQGSPYDKSYLKSHGSCCVEVLPFLKGRKWNNLALAWVHCLRPSSIRVGVSQTADSIPYRVSVTLGPNKTIVEITQEVQVAFCSGYDLRRITDHQGTGELLEDFDQGKVFKDSFGNVTCILGKRFPIGLSQ